MLTKELSVAAIKDGSVIDHVPAGYGLRVLRLLGLLTHQKQVAVGFNLPSQRHGLKDLIKVEGRELTRTELDQIAVLAPHSTVNLIKNFEVSEKIQVSLPEEISEIFCCPNASCITNHEELTTRFRVQKLGRQIYLNCHFCEQRFLRSALCTEACKL